MRCSFCFADNQSTSETCIVCGSPLGGLPPQKPVADSASGTRLNEKQAQFPEPRAILSKPNKTRNAAPEQLQPQELQLIARRKVDETILSAAFWTQNQQDETIAFVTRRGELQLWNPQNDTLQILSTHRTKTTSACLMADFDAVHQRIVLAFEDGGIEFLDVAHGQSSTRLLAHHTKATSLAIASKAETLVVAGEDGTICLWDLSSGKPTPETTLDECGLHRVAIAGDATWLACGNDSGQLQVWNLQTPHSLVQPQWNFDAHRLWVSSLAFSSNAQMLASGGYDGTVHLYASQNGFEMACFPTPDQNTDFGAVVSLCFVGNRFVSIGFAQGVVALLDSWTGTTTPLAHLSSAATHLSASNDGALLLALCHDEMLFYRLPAFPLL